MSTVLEQLRTYVAEMPAVACRARFEELYAELQTMARRELRGRPRTTLDTVALVNEAFLRLDGPRLDASERGPFLALAAKSMRHIMVDHVRARLAEKRGGAWQQVTLSSVIPQQGEAVSFDLLGIEQALQELSALEPRLVDLVECRFFAGMEFSEIAAVMGLSEPTVYRDWKRARAFLQTRLER